MEAYRASTGGSPERARAAKKRLWEELRKTRRGPLLDIMGCSKMLYAAVEEATHFLEFELKQINVRPRPKPLRAPDHAVEQAEPVEKNADVEDGA
jgi:hypothetical protein